MILDLLSLFGGKSKIMNRAISGVGELTPREREILRLVGCGLSNLEIADELIISMPTVKTHLRDILQKLQLRDRGQAVVAA